MPQRRFPRPWSFAPIPGGYRVIDANGLALASVHATAGRYRLLGTNGRPLSVKGRDPLAKRPRMETVLYILERLLGLNFEGSKRGSTATSTAPF